MAGPGPGAGAGSQVAATSERFREEVEQHRRARLVQQRVHCVYSLQQILGIFLMHFPAAIWSISDTFAYFSDVLVIAIAFVSSRCTGWTDSQLHT